MTDAYKLSGSLRAMRRNARMAYVSARPEACHSITMPSTRLVDLADAADLIERQAAELAEWRSVFGHLGATPDECGNVIGAARQELEAEVKALKEAPAVLLTDEQIARALHATTGDPEDGVDFSRWPQHPDGAEFLLLSRVVEALVLSANGKAVA